MGKITTVKTNEIALKCQQTGVATDELFQNCRWLGYKKIPRYVPINERDGFIFLAITDTLKNWDSTRSDFAHALCYRFNANLNTYNCQERGILKTTSYTYKLLDSISTIYESDMVDINGIQCGMDHLCGSVEQEHGDIDIERVTHSLTDLERKIYQQRLDGLSLREIAINLDISGQYVNDIIDKIKIKIRKIL